MAFIEYFKTDSNYFSQYKMKNTVYALQIFNSYQISTYFVRFNLIELTYYMILCASELTRPFAYKIPVQSDHVSDRIYFCTIFSGKWLQD